MCVYTQRERETEREMYNLHSLCIAPYTAISLIIPSNPGYPWANPQVRLEVMGFSAAQQPHAPALPLRQVVLDHTQLAVALHVERLQPYFAAGMQLLEPWSKDGEYPLVMSK